MMSAAWLDGVIMLLVVVSVWRGWRRGLLATVSAVLGLVTGSVAGSRLAAWLIDVLGLPVVARIPVSVAVVLASAVTVASFTGYLGQQLRRRITWKPATWLDSLGGVAFDAGAVLVVVWMIAATVSVVPTPFGRDVRQSRTVQVIDAAMPDFMDAALAQLVKVLDNTGTPRVFFSFGGVRDWDESPADSGIGRDPDVVAASRSVVRLSGQAAGCDGIVVGSGFVFARDRVMTNAHVVAGMSEVSVRDSRGLERSGRVVYFDPRIDVAVVRVSTAGWPALTIARAPERGDSGAAIGFPGGGPQMLAPAVVADVFTARGSDIYGGGAVTRKVIAMHADIRQGDSGGALLDAGGQVRGVVFAVSQDEPGLGYALTPDDVARAVSSGRSAGTVVTTGSCARHD